MFSLSIKLVIIVLMIKLVVCSIKCQKMSNKVKKPENIQVEKLKSGYLEFLILIIIQLSK